MEGDFSWLWRNQELSDFVLIIRPDVDFFGGRMSSVVGFTISNDCKSDSEVELIDSPSTDVTTLLSLTYSWN